MNGYQDELITKHVLLHRSEDVFAQHLKEHLLKAK